MRSLKLGAVPRERHRVSLFNLLHFIIAKRLLPKSLSMLLILSRCLSGFHDIVGRIALCQILSVFADEITRQNARSVVLMFC